VKDSSHEGKGEEWGFERGAPPLYKQRTPAGGGRGKVIMGRGFSEGKEGKGKDWAAGKLTVLLEKKKKS